jgi:hypothetical protein
LFFSKIEAQDWISEVRAKQSKEEEVIILKFSIHLKGKDLLTLHQKNWLNDEVDLTILIQDHKLLWNAMLGKK